MKPFLKWAGNKIHIVERIQKQIGSGKRLIEPFVGSGAVFLNADFEEFVLCDTNQDLIHLFEILKAEGNNFIDYCRGFFQKENNCEDRYYELRELFNSNPEPTLKAALLVYLNRHCYNGLIRYNLQGRFNTPFGRYKTIYFPKEEMLYFHEKAQKAIFTCQDFQKTMLNAQAGDVIYCDPPYAPISKTANFTSYSARPFGTIEQIRLVKMAWLAAKWGSRVIISNHATEFTREAYEGAEVHTFPVRRHISCKGNSRGTVKELLAIFPENPDPKRTANEE